MGCETHDGLNAPCGLERNEKGLKKIQSGLIHNIRRPFAPPVIKPMRAWKPSKKRIWRNKMMVSQNIVTAINNQIGMEFGASMQYEAISVWFASEALPRLARHFAKQAEEEREHAHRFMKFVIDTGGKVIISDIPKPRCEFNQASEAIQLALDHEIRVTEAIKNISTLAVKENDAISQNMLQWFLEEQVEEVSSMDELLRVCKRAGEFGLLQVEQFIASAAKRDG
jgi:ferritin